MRVDGRITHALGRVSTSPATEVPSSRDEMNGRQGLVMVSGHPMHGACRRVPRVFGRLQAIIWKVLGRMNALFISHARPGPSRKCRDPRSLALRKTSVGQNRRKSRDSEKLKLILENRLQGKQNGEREATRRPLVSQISLR